MYPNDPKGKFVVAIAVALYPFTGTTSRTM